MKKQIRKNIIVGAHLISSLMMIAPSYSIAQSYAVDPALATADKIDMLKLVEPAASANTQWAATSIDKSSLLEGKNYFISGDNLNVRSSNSTDGTANVVGKLSLNDEVQIVNLLNEGTPLVQIKIIKSKTVAVDAAEELFVSKDYLSAKSITTAASKYFVIQNVASEKTRVYERCTTSPGCPHKLIFEADMVVGRPEEGTEKDPHAFKTWLGHAKISEWVKFYQDGKGHYPHWYKAGQSLNTIPPRAPRDSDGKPEATMSWGRQWMTKDSSGKDTMYGAFGWYAAKLTPGDETNGLNYQWLHGTIGWGTDGGAAIELTRSFFLNMFSNPGSSGCTRLSNANIAFLNSLLVPGTDVYRVYAKETTRENPCASTSMFGGCKKINVFKRYQMQYLPKKWDFAMTTVGAQKSGGAPADIALLALKGITVNAQNLIEKGSVLIDQYPTAQELNYMTSAASGDSGDRYRIDSDDGEGQSNFSGYFLVDEGRFVNYKHPSTQATRGKIKISGLKEFRTTMPEELVTSGSHYVPKVKYRESSESRYRK